MDCQSRLESMHGSDAARQNPIPRSAPPRRVCELARAARRPLGRWPRDGRSKARARPAFRRHRSLVLRPRRFRYAIAGQDHRDARGRRRPRQSRLRPLDLSGPLPGVPLRSGPRRGDGLEAVLRRFPEESGRRGLAQGGGLPVHRQPAHARVSLRPPLSGGPRNSMRGSAPRSTS